MTPGLPGSARLARLVLRVRDLPACLAYYTDLLGLEVVSTKDPITSLAPAGGEFVLDLTHAPEAPLRPYPCVGLFHFALVVPDRPALGRIFRRLLEANEPFDGMSDHGVSEALYLRDPEQNGIELYWDRPEPEWPRGPDGTLAMFSDPLDVNGVFDSAETADGLDRLTRFGHIHLHVADLEDAEAFYAGALGLQVTQRSYIGARFFAAGDYHHHVGANTWAPNRTAPADATGLVSYTWRVPAGTELPSGPMRDPSGADVLFEAS